MAVFELTGRSSSMEVKLFSGREDVSNRKFSDTNVIRWQEGMPGIVWFDRNYDRAFEVLDYRWDGPHFQEVMIQDNTSDTTTGSKRKGRVAGALIGTLIMPGIGTVIGAAVGTGKKQESNTRGKTISHIERQEVPVSAYMRLRDLSNDMVYTIGFEADSALDARIRNQIACNLEPLEEVTYIEETYEEPVRMIEQRKDEDDVLKKIRELKGLLDEGAISEEEYAVLKRRLFQE